jgi:hypothetical protein
VGHEIAFVLGMHRSGTSMLAGALAALGGVVPDDLLEPAPDNPVGFFEGREVVEAHDELLRSIGASWDDPRPLPPGWVDTLAARRAAERLRSGVDRSPAGGPLVLKDPRLCRLLPLWRTHVLPAADEALALLVVRSEAAVTASLSRREGYAADAAILLHSRYLAEAVAGCDGLPVAVVVDEEMLSDWRRGLRPALDEVGWRPPVEGSDERVDDLLQPGLRHAPDDPSPVDRIGQILRPVLQAAIDALAASAPVLDRRATDELADVLAGLDQAGQGAVRDRDRIWREQDERERALRDEILALSTARDDLERAHRETTEYCYRLEAQRDELVAELEQTRQAKSLRMAAWLRSLGRPEH